MRLEPPCKVSEEKLTFDVRDIEPVLQAPPMDIQPWPEAVMTLKDGRVLYIREPRREEAPAMVNYMKRMIDVDLDFYDIVGARVCAEILGWYRKRLKDPYLMVGLVDGLWAGFANGRVMDEDTNISHHTMALVRGGRIGVVMYYVKAYYAFEVLGNDEFWSTPESYNGWGRYILGMAQNSYPWPEYQHELGGGRIYYITRKTWNKMAKKYLLEMMGADLSFDVPDEIRHRNAEMIIPEQVLV
jgi:hypothetical protein